MIFECCALAESKEEGLTCNEEAKTFQINFPLRRSAGIRPPDQKDTFKVRWP